MEATGHDIDEIINEPVAGFRVLHFYKLNRFVNHYLQAKEREASLTSPPTFKKGRKSVVFDKNVASIFLLYHCMACLHYGLLDGNM